MDKGELIKLADHLSEEAKNLLYANLDKATREAVKISEETGKEPKVKVSISFEWPADCQSPKVESKLGYSVKHEDRSISYFNPLQSTIEFNNNEQ